MIKVQGFGHRNAKLTHEEAIAYHRSVHSKFGLGLADHLGGFVLYYFQEALGADANPLPDFPWDMSAFEWFRDPSYWDNFQKWLETAPDGQEVKHDEASFLDRDQCYMCPYEEQIIVTSDFTAEVVDVMRLLSFAEGVADDAGADYHSTVCVPAIRALFGPTLRKMVVNTITYATRLSSGRIPSKPVNVIEIYKIDRAAFASTRDLVRHFASPAIARAEAEIFAPERTANMIAEEVVFIPLSV